MLGSMLNKEEFLMLLEEIVNLNQWFIDNEKRHGAITKLNKLLSILKSNISVRAPNNRNQQIQIQPFTEEKRAAVEAVKKFNFSELSTDQIECLKLHDAVKHMGPEAAEYLMNVFREEGHDLAYLAAEVTTAHQAISAAKSKITAASNAVSPYSEAVNSVDYLTDKARFSIIFRDGVKVDSLKDLEKRSKEWSAIMHGLGIALGVPPSEFKVLGARNGSLIVDLYMCAAAIVPIGFILNRSLAILERFALSIRRMDEIFELDIDDPAFKHIEQQIKATSEDYFNTKKLISAKKIADEVLDDIECDEEKRAEADTFLQNSIKKILNHLRKGGDLDAFVPHSHIEDESEDGAANNKTAQAVKLIDEYRHKRLELSEDLLKLLEHFDFEDENEAEE